MTGKRFIVGAAVVAAATSGAMAVVASPASAKVGAPITVVTTDAPPPGGKASFDPAFDNLSVCDNEPNLFTTVARFRFGRIERRVSIGRGCQRGRQELPPNTVVSLQVCLSQAATGTGPLVFCSPWESTTT